MNKTLAVTTAVLVLALAAGACTDDTAAPATPAEGSPSTTGPELPAPVAVAEPETPAGRVPAPVPPAAGGIAPASFDARNSTFTLEGRPVSLKNGVSVAPSAPGSASSVTTRHIGSEVRGDLNNDGREDLAFIVTRDGGGSGTFYYAVAAIAAADGYRTTNAFPVGDRIVVQSMTIPRNSNELHVNFARRRPGEPMTARPTADAVLLLKVTPQGVLQGLSD